MRRHLFSCVVLRGSDVVLGDADTRHEGVDAGGEVRVEVLISTTNHGKVVRFVRLFRRRERQTPADSGVCLLSILIGFAWIF